MRIVLAVAMSLIAGSASAMCVGSDTFATCSDDSGNNYTVQRLGNTTYLQGNNYRTGSNWSQESNTIGSTTFHNGRDAQGNSWSSTCINGQCY